MNSTIPSIAFFDVDQTLCNCFSGYHVVRELVQLGIMKKRRLIRALGYNIFGRLLRKMNVRHMYELALADLTGLPMQKLMDIGREVFEKKVRPHIFQEALTEVNRRKKLGHRIAFISSGPRMIIEHIADFFKADAAFSISPRIKDGHLLSSIEEPLCYKEGKVALAQKFAHDHHIKLKDCSFYSDSISDLPLLELVGEAHAVNPDKYLKSEAKKRGWPIHYYTKVLGDDDINV